MSSRSIQSRRRDQAAPACFESLEQRDFLNADLTGGFASLDAVTFAAGSTPVVDFFLKNSGDAKAAAGVVNFFARPVDAVDDSGDIAIGVGKAKGTVAPGAQSPTFHFKLNVPVNAAAGAFSIVGVVDAAGKVSEGVEGEANNTAIGGPLTIAAPDFNLTTAIGDVKMPASILEGASASGTVRIDVNISGAAPVPKTAKVQLQLWIQDQDGGKTLITTLSNQALAGLTSGKPKGFNVKVALGTLATGTYRFFAVVDPLTQQSPVTGVVTESNDTLVDNTSPLSTFSLTVAPAFADLAISGSTTVSGSTTTNSTPTGSVTLVNNGNTDVDGTVNIKFFATTAGVINQNSFQVGSLDNQSVKLKAGQSSKAFNKTLDFSGLTAGSFIIVARVDTVSGITDTNAGNNAQAISTAFNVTVAPLNPGTLGEIGDVVTFVTTDSGSNEVGYSEAGNFTTNRGVTGIYTYSVVPLINPITHKSLGTLATLSLTAFGNAGATSAFAGRITSKNPPANLINKTLTFSDKTGSVSWRAIVLFYGANERDGKFSIA
jgi:hypothetical protein